ncbi:MAG: hypothetical protein ACFFDN_04085 [Candidatus Hodarchaeota archaeon]
MSEKLKLGENIVGYIKEGKLILEIDLTVPKNELKPSKSGKTLIVASTRGNINIDFNQQQFKLGVNCYISPEKK